MGAKDLQALVIFSGGQDSTTCLYWAKSRFSKIKSLTFDYGQRHRIELQAAEKIAKLAGVEHEVLKLSGFDSLGSNSLTGSREVDLSKDKTTGLPNTFVPGRNIIFLTYAAAYAYSRGITEIVAGMCETDFSGYPDCRKKTLDATISALSLGMEREFVLHAPLMNLTKAQTVLLAKELLAFDALAHSHTCYNGNYPPCGKCEACLLRAKGFAEAGEEDPIHTRNHRSSPTPS